MLRSLEGKQILFLASIDWDAPWQRHQSWAAAFAEAGHEVFFVENTGLRSLRFSDLVRVLKRLIRMLGPAPEMRADPRLKVVAPGVLPHSNFVWRALNRRVFIPRLVEKLKNLGLRPKPVVFVYLPTHTTHALLDALDPGLTVYDCVDHFAGNPDAPKDLEATESRLVRRADAVVTTSRFLYEKSRALSSKVHELHHGASEAFLKAGEAIPPLAYKKFCYFGTVWNALDYKPIAALAEAGFEITLIGPVKEPPPPLPPAVQFREGRIAPGDLPKALSEFDAYLLPYADTAYNQGVLPAKTYECLSSGKPVLASPIPELRRFIDVLYVADDPARWVEIARRLSQTESPERRHARVALARSRSTKAQFEKLRRILEEV